MQANTFSVMILMSGRVNGRAVTDATTLSHVMANKRMIYINILKKVTTVGDIKSLIAFTKKWTSEIADANK